MRKTWTRSRSSSLTYWEGLRAPRIAPLIAQHARPGSLAIAVDLGCGSGALMRQLSWRFDMTLGIDNDLATLATTSNSIMAKDCLILGDLIRLPLASKVADFVFSYGAFHHVDERRALEEVKRVLAPRGTAVIIDFVRIDGDEGQGIIKNIMIALRALTNLRRQHGLWAAVRVTVFRLSPRWLAHVRRDDFLTPCQFTSIYGAALTGCDIYRLPRSMLAVWHKPKSVMADNC